MGAGVVAPSGVVTFLFTDVEGSTRLWAADPDAMSASLRVHDGIVRDAIESRGGYVFTTAGDSFAAAFSQASVAVEAAVAVQADLAGVAWPGPELRVRIGVHLGETEERGGDYFGPVVNASARVEAAGHGGQIVVTEPVQSVVGRADAVSLGEHQLRDLPEPLRLFQIGSGEFPPLRGLTTAADNLPKLRSRLLGREREIGELVNLLRSERLVTVVGPGGIGKTSVAVETAGKVGANYPGGVHFIDLAAVVEGDGVVGAVCRGVRLVATTAPYDQLVEFLSMNATLLVVDNCEHLIDDAVEIIDQLITDVDGVTILATSREYLDVVGERVVRIGPLGANVGEAAVRLFVERFAAVQPDVDPSSDDLERIATICRRLDGIPLAIELAAARGMSMTIEEIEARLDDRFSLLAGGRRGKLRRHQTLRATLDWSISLLPDDDIEALARLSVYVDGFDLAGAAAVSALSSVGAADAVASLHGKSLIQRVGDTRGKARYRLLETIREWGLEELDRRSLLGEVRNLHAKRFVDQFARADPIDYMRVGFEWFHDVADIALAVSHIEHTDPTAAAMLAGANSFSLIEAGYGPLIARVTALDLQTVPAEERARLYTARRAVADSLFIFESPDPPPNDGTRDWRLLIGDSSTGYSGISGYYTAFLTPGTVLRTVDSLDPVGPDRDDLVMRLDSMQSACIAACHLGQLERSIQFGTQMLELASRADVGSAGYSVGPYSIVASAVQTGTDLRRLGLTEYLAGNEATVFTSYLQPFAEADPDEWRPALARAALALADGRMPGVESMFLSVFAFWAIEDGELDRARHLNDLVNLRVHACLSLKRANHIRIEALPPELLHDEGHHRQMMLEELADLAPKPGARQAMLDDASRLLD